MLGDRRNRHVESTCGATEGVASPNNALVVSSNMKNKPKKFSQRTVTFGKATGIMRIPVSIFILDKANRGARAESSQLDCKQPRQRGAQSLDSGARLLIAYSRLVDELAGWWAGAESSRAVKVFR